MIITILNGDKWIDNCMESIVKQTAVQSHERHQKRNHHELQPYVTQHYEAQNPFMSTMTTSPLQLATRKTIDIKSNNAVALQQLHIEVCVFDDFSCDNTPQILLKWQHNLRENYNIEMKIVSNTMGKSKGGNCDIKNIFFYNTVFTNYFLFYQHIFLILFVLLVLLIRSVVPKLQISIIRAT